MTRLLIVDDDAPVRRMLSLAFPPPEFQVEQAADGSSAAECLLASVPDIVILDIEMPDVSGLEFCRRMRNHADAGVRQTGIILMSGQFSGSGPATPDTAGADHLIGKPFNVAALRALVHDLSARVRQRRQTAT